MKKIKNTIFTGLSILAFTSCHHPVFDYEGDCEVTYGMRFVYDMNLKWADAFPSEVNSVNLYVFDNKGLFVKEFLGRGDQLNYAGYEMPLDLAPGTYSFVAWCGLYNPDTDYDSFSVIEPVPGKTTIQELTCSLNTLADAENPVYSDRQLDFMYHGMLENQQLPDSQDGAHYVYTIYLTKDTNHIRIILQQLSGENMNPADYGFSITDANANLNYDNSPAQSDEVLYLPWDKVTGEAGVGKEEGSGINIVYVDGVIADFSVSRLLADHSKEMMLTISDLENGKTIATVPLIQYALLAKEYYVKAYKHPMTEQEFLDREDEYILTFFIDENNKWLDSSILIHSWRVVLGRYGV